MRWLSALDNSGISSELPLVANPNTLDQQHNGGVWHIKGCSDIFTVGWYQPMVLNKLALERVAFPSKNYGLRDTCNSFVISQDVGIGTFVWLMELNHIYMPGVEINPAHQGEQVFRPNQMVVHGIRHERDDLCDKPEKWPASVRYNQKLVVGCGDVNEKTPFHDPSKHAADMYDAWNYFSKHGENLFFDQDKVHDWFKQPVILYPTPTSDGKVRIKKILNANEEKQIADGLFQGEKVEYRIIPRVTPLKGYRETDFAKQHDLQKKWVMFGPNDCKDKGTIQK
eukprot:scaffold4354_cov196-Ochromonas_danica.AAC.7